MTQKPDLESLVRDRIPDHLITSVNLWCEAMAEGQFEAARLIACDDLPGLVLMLQHVSCAGPTAAGSTDMH